MPIGIIAETHLLNPHQTEKAVQGNSSHFNYHQHPTAQVFSIQISPRLYKD